MNLDGPYTVEKVTQIEEKLKALENVSILINNAGIATYGLCGDPSSWDYTGFLSCVYVNTFPLPIVTKFILPKILA